MHQSSMFELQGRNVSFFSSTSRRRDPPTLSLSASGRKSLCVCAFRDVGGVTAPQPSLSQLKDKGQGVEPVWSTKLSPDSACSEGSAGSVEQQQDAGTRAVCSFTCRQ